MGLIIVLGQSFLLFGYCFYLNKFPNCFGDFKKKFEKYNICSYYYTFIVFERLFVSGMIIFLRNLSFGLGSVLIIVLGQLIFVAVRKPYVCGGSTRPIINLSVTAINVLLILVSNILPSVIILQTIVPIIICLLLTTLLASSIYYIVTEFKEIYASPELNDINDNSDGKR